MREKYFSRTEEGEGGLRVLTVTAKFPNLIQPWLVNHLVQISKNNGDNRIVSLNKTRQNYSREIDEYELDKKCYLLNTSKVDLLISFLRTVFIPKNVLRFTRIVKPYYHFSGVFQLGLREFVFGFLALPAFTPEFDLIHCHSEPAGNRLLPLLKANGAPIVITFHGLPPAGVKPLTEKERKTYTNAALAIFVNTRFAKKQYVSLGAPCEKIQIIPQGLNLSSWPYTERCFPRNSTINLLTVGRLHPDKGHTFALKAVRKLIDNGTNIRYTIVGGGPERRSIEDEIEELGLIQVCDIHSDVSDELLRKIYGRSHIFLLPSVRAHDGFHEETQGVVLQEAQASGLITVATKTGGIPECIDDGVSGFLVKDRDTDSIVSVLEMIISQPEKWSEWQKSGRKWVEKNFGDEVIGLKMQEAYRAVISEFTN